MSLALLIALTVVSAGGAVLALAFALAHR